MPSLDVSYITTNRSLPTTRLPLPPPPPLPPLIIHQHMPYGTRAPSRIRMITLFTPPGASPPPSATTTTTPSTTMMKLLRRRRGGNRLWRQRMMRRLREGSRSLTNTVLLGAAEQAILARALYLGGREHTYYPTGSYSSVSLGSRYYSFSRAGAQLGPTQQTASSTSA